jgi:hypothetical protein
MGESYFSQILANVSAQFTGKSEGKGKGKSITMQVWADPEVFSRLRLPDFKIIKCK